ncbi:hypothetical protein QC762_0038210 [Podospora pseudocomata]|uniref:Uncharacterized protein n=1 Tax=Podospora pseudocomata TaxID=2093779 RepID=A0ABR0GLX9_9PEZI|nr:hypothetical protein QC762_0038210 [Podospora pseudocomata]
MTTSNPQPHPYNPGTTLHLHTHVLPRPFGTIHACFYGEPKKFYNKYNGFNNFPGCRDQMLNFVLDNRPVKTTPISLDIIPFTITKTVIGPKPSTLTTTARKKRNKKEREVLQNSNSDSIKRVKKKRQNTEGNGPAYKKNSNILFIKNLSFPFHCLSAHEPPIFIYHKFCVTKQKTNPPKAHPPTQKQWYHLQRRGPYMHAIYNQKPNPVFFTRPGISSLNLALNPLLQPSPRNDLLHIWRELTHLLAPLLATLTLGDSDLAPPHIPHQLPARPPGKHLVTLTISLESLPQPLHQPWYLNAHQRIVDAVPAKNVTKAA